MASKRKETGRRGLGGGNGEDSHDRPPSGRQVLDLLSRLDLRPGRGRWKKSASPSTNDVGGK